VSHKRPALERERDRADRGDRGDRDRDRDRHYSHERGGDDTNEGSSVSASGSGGAPMTFIRAIISTKMVGAVIGRGGGTVRSIREETATRITISEPVPSSSERILTISGGLDGVAKAYSLIHAKIEEANLVSQPPSSVFLLPSTIYISLFLIIFIWVIQENPPQPGEGRFMLKVLVPNSQAGSIIGKGGAKIKETQEATGGSFLLCYRHSPLIHSFWILTFIIISHLYLSLYFSQDCSF
jgi:predicted RNA-binding protein YlqC (UPF0109 family)